MTERAVAPPAPALAEALPCMTEETPVPDIPASLREAVEAHERGLLLAALERLRWNQRKVAGALGMTYDQLRHCLKKHGLHQRRA